MYAVKELAACSTQPSRKKKRRRRRQRVKELDLEKREKGRAALMAELEVQTRSKLNGHCTQKESKSISLFSKTRAPKPIATSCSEVQLFLRLRKQGQNKRSVQLKASVARYVKGKKSSRSQRQRAVVYIIDPHEYVDKGLM